MTTALLLTREQAAELLGIAVKHFDRHVAHKLPRVMIGRLVRFRTLDVEAWVDGQAGGPPARNAQMRGHSGASSTAPATSLPDTPRSRRLLMKPREYSMPRLELSPKAEAMRQALLKPSRVVPRKT